MFLRRTFTTAALVGALGAGLVAASLPAGAVACPAAPAKHAVTRAVPFTAVGTVQATDTTADTLTVAKSPSVTVSVPDTAIVYRNWTRANLADLVVGDWIGVAGLKQTDGTLVASRVLVLAPRPVPFSAAGKLTATDTATATLTLAPPKGAALTVHVSASAIIRRNGKVATLADLAVNDQVAVAGMKQVDGTLVADRVLAVAPRPVPFIAFGKVSAVNATAGTVTVAPRPGVINVPTTAHVYRNWAPATLADVAVNDLIGVAGTKQVDGTYTAKLVRTLAPRAKA